MANYYNQSSAIARRSQFIIKTLQDAKYSVSVLTTANSSNLFRFPNNILLVHHNKSFNEGGFLERLITEFILAIKFSHKLLSIRADYDLVILTSPPFIMNFLCGVFSYFINMPYIIDIRDRYPDVLFNLKILNPRGYLGRFLKLAEWILLKKAKRVIVSTKKLGFEISRDLKIELEIMRNGYDLDLFHKSINSNKIDEKEKLKIVIHGLFGSLFDELIFMSIVNYCSHKSTKHQFMLAGYGPKIDIILSWNLPNIIYLGNLDNDQLLLLLSSCDLGLSIHLDIAKNTFPVKVFEYIGMGLPSIVIPKSEAGDEVVKEQMGWSFSSENWELCAKLIVDLSYDKTILNDVKKNVENKKNLYSRQEQAKIILKIIEDVGNANQ